MAIGANSYGDTGEIAALVPIHTNAGSFDGTTNPTLTRVEGLVDQVSAILNLALATYGFSVPATQADFVLVLDSFVNEAVAEIVEGMNGHGRYGPTKPGGGSSRWRGAVTKEGLALIEEHVVGIERLGETRTYSQLDGMAYRDTDEEGDDTFPIFQRAGFGNEFTDWDS